jgi:hypothetical protein
VGRTGGLRALAGRVRVKLLVEAKMLLQRLGVPRRADVLFLCAWDWRYPTFLYVSLRDRHVVECPRADLPFFLAHATLREFFLRVRGLRPGDEPTADAVISAREGDLTPRFGRRIQLDFDYFAAEPAAGALTMPYFAHPEFYRRRLDVLVPSLRDGTRHIRLLFAGTRDDAVYQQRFAFPLLNRSQILDAIEAGLPGAVTTVRTRAGVASLRMHGERGAALVLSSQTDERGTERHLLSQREYLDLLARSDFFLAPPGVVMPLCHNIVEAMSVGTVPVTNYGHLLSPPLRPDVECIAFSTEAELVAQVRRVLDMTPEEIAELRANVVRYYDLHLSPSAFGRALASRREPRLTLRVNAEPGR